MPDTGKLTAHYCVSTHWDREWYEPFQEYRMWLVEILDGLLDLLDKRPDFKHAHLDGQTVMLEDYLDIRPENEERLVARIQEGRISVGPWYVLPDEWLISGESYIRNFMVGRKVCARLGVPIMDYCYTPDQFGHIAALPMIARGAGLKAGIVWRGTGDDTYPPHFAWIGPDGSRLPTHKLFDEAAYGAMFHRLRDLEGVRDYEGTALQEMIARSVAHERGRIQIPLMLILDGNDHQAFKEDMADLFAGMVRDFPDIAWEWTSLEDYGEKLAAHADALPEYRGELREPSRSRERPYQYLIVHVISSRYPLKQRNDQCQAWLERWAEPSALMQVLAGGKPVMAYLDQAWRYLLKNQPHDSICGCSVDQVHRDMMYRYDQAEMLAEGLTRRAQIFLAPPSEAPETPQCYTAHNPLPFARRGIFECALSFPPNWPEFFVDGLSSGEPRNCFEIVDASGGSIPFQLCSIERNRLYKRVRADGRPKACHGDTYHVAVELDLPPAGYMGFEVRPVSHAVRNHGSLRCGRMSAQNEFLTLDINADGTADLRSALTGCHFRGLFQYEDSGDVGDGWTYGDLINDQVVVSPGTRVTTSIDEDGPLRTVFRIEREFDLPVGLRTGMSEDLRGDWHRSERRATLRVTDLISVERGTPFVRVRTTVDNTIRDHRFRVGFPTHAETEVSFADTPFAVVERDIVAPEESATWHERVNPEKAFTSFFGVEDTKGGLAVVAPFGLHEYEVTQTPDRSLMLTLFRSTHKTVQTNGEPDGWLLRKMNFEYLLIPFAEKADRAALARIASEAQTGVRVLATAEAPAPVSFLEVEGDGLVPTSMKAAEDGQGGIVRLWNPTDTAQAAVLRVTRPLRQVWRCNLLEDVEEEVPFEQLGTVAVRVEAGALMTLRFAW